MPTLSLVVPCFNEEKAIPIFFEESQKILFELKSQKKISSYEFVFVDDGSSDGTLEVLRKLHSIDCSVKYISFSRNFGKEAALFAALKKAGGDFVATLDADMQDPPALIPQMLDCVASGRYECAATRRSSRKGESAVRSFFAKSFYKIMKLLTEIEVVSGARDFRVMSRKYVTAVLSLCERCRFSKGIFPWVGFRTKWFEFENVERSAGKTKWSFLSLLSYSLDGITGFSTKPLALASVLGILSFAASFAMIAFICVRKFVLNNSVEGWASMACIILFASGTQLFCTGILGQCVAKMFLEVKRRPHFLVAEESG